MHDMLNNELLQLAVQRIRERNRREIERAIDRVKDKQVGWDDSFRRNWYRAAWRRRDRCWIRPPQNECDGGVDND